MSSDPEVHTVIGYEAVRAAARDFASFSSDLQGDRDVRTYRQLPLEADPPRHTKFREALQPLFMGDAIASHSAAFSELARELIRSIKLRGGCEIASEFALPYVIGCLGIIYNRPQDVSEWTDWGPDVWTAEAHMSGEVTAESRRALRERRFDLPSQRSGAVLQEYLERVFDEAEARLAEPSLDVWDTVARLEIDGQRITRDEMYGIANVLLAGGRDTVIKLVTGITWHLAGVPSDRALLQSDSTLFNGFIAEMVRYLTPLPKMERIARGGGSGGERVLLSFVSANHDSSVWEQPDQIDLHRPRKPHLAFGFGRHSCMGMNITEHEARALLRVLLDEWPGWELSNDVLIEWATELAPAGEIIVIDRFDSVPVRVVS